MNIKLFKDFITESTNIVDSFSKIDVENKEIEVYESKIKELFSFVGDGISNIEETSIHSQKGNYYTNEVILTFTEEPHGTITKRDWDKIENILDPLCEKDGFDSYIMNPSHNQLVLTFDQNYPIGIY